MLLIDEYNQRLNAAGKDIEEILKALNLDAANKELAEIEKTDSSGLISLDLIVRMININKGRNPGFERKSKTLSGYAIFVAKVREYEKRHTFDAAVKLAVEYCQKKDILEDYFKQNSSEAVSMNFTKYNERDARRELRKEAMEIGIKEGREKGLEEGMEKGIKEGERKGEKKGEQRVLDLMAQGLTYEEIKKKIEKTAKKPKRA